MIGSAKKISLDFPSGPETINQGPMIGSSQFYPVFGEKNRKIIFSRKQYVVPKFLKK
jgi:hypothetical protein